jgi:phosphatidylglycerol:prolipoprotein diacylglycerol transferase
MVLFITVRHSRRVYVITFSLIVALGSALGLVWVALERSDGEYSRQINIGVGVLIGALIGSRAAYVGVNWEYFQDHLIETVQPWLGGLSWPGALAGGYLTLVLMAWTMGAPLGSLADDLRPLLVSLSVAVWLGCWVEGCAYGPESSVGLPAQDEWGVWKERVPVQLFGAILTIALFWTIEALRCRWPQWFPGLAAILGLVGLSLIMFGASMLRADPGPLYAGIRLETWGAILFLGISVLMGIWAWFWNYR